MAKLTRILVIDDNEDLRLLLRLMLREYTVFEASNGKQGMEVFRSQSPELVITDMIMPQKSGIETIQELRHEDPIPKIIAISGGGGASGAEEYLAVAAMMGVASTLSKPFNAQELVQVVEKTLGV